MSLASKVKIIDGTLRETRRFGFESRLTPETLSNIVQAGFNRATLKAAFVLCQLALLHQPLPTGPAKS